MITGHGDGCWPDGLSVTPPSSVGFWEIVLSSTDKKMSCMLLICRVRVSQTMEGCGDFRALWASCPLNRWGEGPERLGVSSGQFGGPQETTSGADTGPSGFGTCSSILQVYPWLMLVQDIIRGAQHVLGSCVCVCTCVCVCIYV